MSIGQIVKRWSDRDREREVAELLGVGVARDPDGDAVHLVFHATHGHHVRVTAVGAARLRQLLTQLDDLATPRPPLTTPKTAIPPPPPRKP